MAPRLLTPREIEVLKLVKEGLTPREIGEHLGIGEGTVDTHLLRAGNKLHVSGRENVVAAAERRGDI